MRRRQPERGLHRLQDLRPTRVADPAGDVVDLQVVVGQEAADVVAEVLLDQSRYLGAEDDLQPGGADVPAHRPSESGYSRLRESSTRVPDVARSAPTTTTAAAPSPNRPLATRLAVDGRCAGRSASTSRPPAARDVAGPAEQVVVDPGESGRATEAAQPEQRHPADVLPQPDPGGDPCLERRYGDPGDRGRHDQVDVGRGQPGGPGRRSPPGCRGRPRRR